MRTIRFVLPHSGLDAAEVSRREEVASRDLPPGFVLDSVTSESAPNALNSDADFQSAAAGLESTLDRLDSSEVDVAILGGALDPALERLRSLSDVPLVGPGESALNVAGSFRGRLSLVTINEASVRVAWDLLTRHLPQSSVASVRSMDTSVPDLVADLAAARSILMRECRRAVEEDGASAVVLGSMTLGSLGSVAELHAELGVPIVDPLSASVFVAVQCSYAARPAR